MEDNVRLANRVSQLEAHNWNSEFNKTIDQLVENLNVPSVSEEVKLLAKLYLSANQLKDGTNIGLKLYNLNYRDVSQLDHSSQTALKNHKLILLTASNLVLPYILKRYATMEELLKKSFIGRLRFDWLTLDNVVMAFKFVRTINFVLFLRSGKYLLLQERLLQLVPGSSDYRDNTSINQVQMELISRDTLWKAIAEFITAVLPHINTVKIKNQLSSFSSLIHMNRNEMKLSEKIFKSENAYKCAHCGNQPFNPYIIGCRHVFCYYCLYSRYSSDSSVGFVCPSCNYKTDDKNEVRRYRVFSTVQQTKYK